MILQARDRHLLSELAVMRIIDREQAKLVAPFGSTTRANVRLLALTRTGLVRRFFVGTNRGAQKALYALTQKGAQLVGVPLRGLRRPSDRMLVADFSVIHQLRINEVYCLVKYQPLPITGSSFGRWVAFHAPLAGDLALIPDGYAEISVNGGTLATFLEVDLGHESRTVWRKKVQAYLRFALSGEFERHFHQSRFRVLVVAGSDRRTASLRMATAEVTDKVFWFTTFDRIAKDGFWSAIWMRPTDDRAQPLIPKLP
jgi:hypothetical protein